MTDTPTEPMTELALFELLSLECRVAADGTVQYCNAQGQLHRVHGPAFARPDGYCSWWQNGQLHRVDGPAVEWANGARDWYRNGRRHRIDGPAVVDEDGTHVWYQNGQRHRLDGPAIECPDGARAWHINGIELTEDAWIQAVASMENV